MILNTVHQMLILLYNILINFMQCRRRLVSPCLSIIDAENDKRIDRATIKVEALSLSIVRARASETGTSGLYDTPTSLQV